MIYACPLHILLSILHKIRQPVVLMLLARRLATDFRERFRTRHPQLVARIRMFGVLEMIHQAS